MRCFCTKDWKVEFLIYKENSILNYFNPFSLNVPFLYPMKTSENRRCSDVFRGYRSRALIENWLMTRFSTLLQPFMRHDGMNFETDV